MYAPGIQDISGELLMRGIGGMGDRLGAGLGDLGERIQKQKDEEKQKATLARSARAMAVASGVLTKEQADIMDGESVLGTLKGAAIKEDRARQQQQQDLLAEQIARLKQAGVADDALGRVAQRLTQPAAPGAMDLMNFDQGQPRAPLRAAEDPAPGTAAGGGDFQTRLLQALRDNPEAFRSPQFDNSANSLERILATQGHDGSPVAKELPGGYLGFTLPGSKQLDVRPDLTKQESQASELHDADGNVIGHRIPIGGGKFSFRPLKDTSGELKPATVEGKAVPGIYVDATGKVHDLRDTLTKAIGGDNKAVTAPASSAAAPAVKPPKVGDVVQGYRFKGGDPKAQASWEKVK